MPGDSVRRARVGNYLLTIAFDVYTQPVERTVADLADAHFNMSPVHEDTWEGHRIYVIGAPPGDLHSRQLWIDRDRLIYLRTLAPAPQDTTRTMETRFEDYFHRPDGSWFVQRVEFYGPDGKLQQLEQFTDAKFNAPLDPQLFVPPAGR
jgi:hypothetical protein